MVSFVSTIIAERFIDVPLMILLLPLNKNTLLALHNAIPNRRDCVVFDSDIVHWSTSFVVEAQKFSAWATFVLRNVDIVGGPGRVYTVSLEKGLTALRRQSIPSI